MNRAAQAPRPLLASNVLAIETPEGVRFSLPLAGPANRFLAWFIDTMAIGAACSSLSALFQILGAISADVMAMLTVISYFVIWAGYGIAFEWIWRGQTPGKRVLGLRVLDASGQKLQFSQIAIRNLMRSVDALPVLYLTGGASMILTRRYQRLGDLAANTIVIRRRRLCVPDLTGTDREEKFNSFFEVPHLAARLRQQVSPELAQIAYEALLRRDELAPETRIEVLHRIAHRFRETVKFPDELTASLTDERYVRNALQVVTAKGNLRRRTVHS